MNFHETLLNKTSSSASWLRRIWHEPLTFIVLVWLLMSGLAGLCFAVVD